MDREYLDDIVRPLLQDDESAKLAFLGVRHLADVTRTAGLLAQASHYRRPAWYREDRAGDRYVCTLRSGEVLAWAQDEPGARELVVWTHDFAGSVIWRES